MLRRTWRTPSRGVTPLVPPCAHVNMAERGSTGCGTSRHPTFGALSAVTALRARPLFGPASRLTGRRRRPTRRGSGTGDPRGTLVALDLVELFADAQRPGRACLLVADGHSGRQVRVHGNGGESRPPARSVCRAAARRRVRPSGWVQRSRSLSPAWSTGLGPVASQRKSRFTSSIATSLMFACRLAISPAWSNSQFSLP